MHQARFPVDRPTAGEAAEDDGFGLLLPFRKFGQRTRAQQRLARLDKGVDGHVLRGAIAPLHDHRIGGKKAGSSSSRGVRCPWLQKAAKKLGRIRSIAIRSVDRVSARFGSFTFRLSSMHSPIFPLPANSIDAQGSERGVDSAAAGLNVGHLLLPRLEGNGVLPLTADRLMTPTGASVLQ